jgi:hypothetical protein
VGGGGRKMPRGCLKKAVFSSSCKNNV